MKRAEKIEEIKVGSYFIEVIVLEGIKSKTLQVCTKNDGIYIYGTTLKIFKDVFKIFTVGKQAFNNFKNLRDVRTYFYLLDEKEALAYLI